MDTMTFCVPCLFGLEGLVGDELRRLDLQNVRVEDRRVFFEGDFAAMAKANLCCRMGERVMILLAEFDAHSFEDLFQGVKAVPLERFIPKDGAFPVKGYSLESALHSVPDCQKIIKKAVVESLKRRYRVGWFAETGALYQIQFSLVHDTATLYLDTTGTPLHKRGYRPAHVAAPLRETLAAALVDIAGYRGRGDFCDPFCGSGTIAIEAALIARNRAPGLNRSFAAQHWATLDKMLWLDAADEAMDNEFHGKYEIWGGDIDPDAVELSRHNAELAEVDDIVKFEVDDATRFHWGGLYGRIVTNPPYGERLLEREEAGELYKAFGKAMDKLPDTWRVYVLSSHPDFERCYGRFADKKRKLYNGMLKCDLFMYGKRL